MLSCRAVTELPKRTSFNKKGIVTCIWHIYLILLFTNIFYILCKFLC